MEAGGPGGRGPNWTEQESKVLLAAIDRVKPRKTHEWEKVWAIFRSKLGPVIANNRDIASMKKRFKSLHAKPILSSDPKCPAMVLKARKIVGKIRPNKARKFHDLGGPGDGMGADADGAAAIDELGGEGDDGEEEAEGGDTTNLEALAKKFPVPKNLKRKLVDDLGKNVRAYYKYGYKDYYENRVAKMRRINNKAPNPFVRKEALQEGLMQLLDTRTKSVTAGVELDDPMIQELDADIKKYYAQLKVVRDYVDVNLFAAPLDPNSGPSTDGMIALADTAAAAESQDAVDDEEEEA